MINRERLSEGPTSTTCLVQQLDWTAPQAAASASSPVMWPASSVRMQPVLRSPAGVLRVQQLKGNRAVSQMLAVQQPAETQRIVAKPNHTGLPANLKAGIESLSGLPMDAVRVHYNSSQPAQLNALAYTQGTEIHVAPGQERHLPHEAWHVVQQAQGRVQPTMRMKDGVPVNDDAGLEHEADVMGAKALAPAAQATARGVASACYVAQLYKPDYVPNLAGLTIPTGGIGVYNYQIFTRPGDWYENTLNRLYARALNNDRVKIVDVRGTQIVLVRCESAGSWHNITDMQIGHIQNWQGYVRDTQPATVREATNAYNDLNNLRLEGSTANTSHDFEKGRQSEDDDTDLDDDDFIDKSDKGKMEPEARKLLDGYKAGRASYFMKSTH